MASAIKRRKGHYFCWLAIHIILDVRIFFELSSFTDTRNSMSKILVKHTCVQYISDS